jgi:ActR/RegA family two-component response regulator
MDSVGTALENADDEDIISIDEIESEISQMEELGEEINTGAQPVKIGSPDGKGDPFAELVSMRNKLDEMIKNFGGGSVQEEAQLQSDEMSPTEFNGATGLEENEMGADEITDDDINAVLGASSEEGEVDEAHGVSHSAGKGIQSVIPKPEYLSTGEASRRRFNNESEVKMTSLIEENKKLTKKLNESKKYKQSVSTLVESYKNALEKYRNQLKEMAIFNTNLAHVNNLLVNESLALTQDDKIKIINGFKQVGSITESQEKYKTFLTEMKESKKTISENVETKVTASIQPSSKQKLDEVVEKTAYANDEHINKMKRLIEYVEGRGKKNNL